MTRQVAFYGIVLGTLAFAACDGHPQAPAPTSLGQPQAIAPQSAPPNPSNSLVGLYTLTLNTRCAALPEAERTRKYTATIDSPGGGQYVVTLSDATFLTGQICTGGSRHFSGIGCHQFFASQDSDTVQFFLENNNDEAHGGHIVEQLSSGTWLEIIGTAGGKIDSSPLSSIEASGTGSVWYCRTPSSYPYFCHSVVSCGSTDIQLTLTRK